MNWYRARVTTEAVITFSAPPGSSEDQIHDAALSEAARMLRGQVLHVDNIEMTVDTSNSK